MSIMVFMIFWSLWFILGGIGYYALIWVHNLDYDYEYRRIRTVGGLITGMIFGPFTAFILIIFLLSFIVGKIGEFNFWKIEI